MEQIVKNKYHGGKIYTLRSPSTDKIYIGSTTQPLYKRIYEHRSSKSNDISKLDDFYIELLENFKCENREQLDKREGELIRENKDNSVNKNIAGRTKKESMKAYYEKNKEKIINHQREYYKEKVKCGGCDKEISKNNLSSHQKTSCKKNII